MRSLATFIALTIAVPLALYVLGPAPMYAALSRQGKSTQGVVTSSKCRKSHEFEYGFNVASHPYAGSGSVIGCTGYAPRARITVVYLPEDPALNFYDDPKAAYTNYLVATALATLLFPGAITFAFHLRRQARVKHSEA